VVDDAAVLHRCGLGPEQVARVVDGAENNLHALGAETNFFMRVPPATTDLCIYIYIYTAILTCRMSFYTHLL